MDVLINFMEIILSKYIGIANHHIKYFKYIILLVNYISIKLKKLKRACISFFFFFFLSLHFLNGQIGFDWFATHPPLAIDSYLSFLYSEFSWVLHWSLFPLLIIVSAKNLSLLLWPFLSFSQYVLGAYSWCIKLRLCRLWPGEWRGTSH